MRGPAQMWDPRGFCFGPARREPRARVETERQKQGGFEGREREEREKGEARLCCVFLVAATGALDNFLLLAEGRGKAGCRRRSGARVGAGA